jgi:hypothetical protein
LWRRGWLMGEGDGATRIPESLNELGAKQFLRRAQSYAVILRVLTERIRAGDLALAVELKRLAHEIQGKGGVFGFLAISACAGAIKELAG